MSAISFFKILPSSWNGTCKDSARAASSSSSGSFALEKMLNQGYKLNDSSPLVTHQVREKCLLFTPYEESVVRIKGFLLARVGVICVLVIFVNQSGFIPSGGIVLV